MKSTTVGPDLAAPWGGKPLAEVERSGAEQIGLRRPAREPWASARVQAASSRGSPHFLAKPSRPCTLTHRCELIESGNDSYRFKKRS